MKNIYTFLFCLFAMTSVFAQGELTFDVSQINFGNVNELQTPTQQVLITNNANYSVEVREVVFFDIYGEPTFSSNWNTNTIAANSSMALEVSINVVHNILHETEVVIVTKGGVYSIDLDAQGTYSKTYYNATQNLFQEDLKDALTALLGTNTNSLGYNTGRDRMFMDIDNKTVNGEGASSNTLEGVYTGQIINHTSRSDAQNQGFNTEHTWPQSKGAGSEPMKSDIHHLYPTNGTANSVRSSYAFDNVVSPTWSEGGSKRGNNANGQIRFEPRDEQKGPVARTMLYFATRYMNQSGVDISFLSTQEFRMREWAELHPPTNIDQLRNDKIFSYQNNRNPYIDYPQFLDRISSILNTASEPLVMSSYLPLDTINFGNVAAQEQESFPFVVVNNGDVPINFSNFVLSNPGILQINGIGSSVLVQPGESLEFTVEILLQGTQTVVEALTFTSSENGTTNYNIPVYGNSAVGIFTPSQKPVQLEAFPNPTTESVSINIPEQYLDGKLKVYNNSGQLVKSLEVDELQEVITMDSLSKGIYFISLSKDDLQILMNKIVLN